MSPNYPTATMSSNHPTATNFVSLVFEFYGKTPLYESALLRPKRKNNNSGQYMILRIDQNFLLKDSESIPGTGGRSNGESKMKLCRVKFYGGTGRRKSTKNNIIL